MGFFQRVRGLFGGGQTRGVEGVALNIDSIGGTTSFNRGPVKRGTRELIAAYREQPWLRAVTGRIARGVSAMEWRLYVRTEAPAAPLELGGQRMAPPFRLGVDRAVRDRRLRIGPGKARAQHRAMLLEAGLLREVVDHPMLDLLETASADLIIGGRSALHLTQLWLDLKGEGFWILRRDSGTGSPNGFLPIPPHWVVNVPTGVQPYYRVSFSGLQMNVSPKDMLWFRDLDPENPLGRGTGVGEALGDELETDEYTAKYLKAWYFNNAMPSGVVSWEGAGDKALKDAQARWDNEHRGATQGNRLHFASGKMTFAKIDNSFKDQALPELRRSLRDTVAQVYGVPPELIGIIENSNRSTIGAAEYIFALGVRYPRQEFLRETIQQQLAFQYDDKLVLDYEAEMPVDPAFSVDVMKAQAPAFKLNEWRAKAGFDPDPELEGQRSALMPGQNDAAGTDDTENDQPAENEGDPSEKPDPDDADRGDPKWARALRSELKRRSA